MSGTLLFPTFLVALWLPFETTALLLSDILVYLTRLLTFRGHRHFLLLASLQSLLVQSEEGRDLIRGHEPRLANRRRGTLLMLLLLLLEQSGQLLAVSLKR